MLATSPPPEDFGSHLEKHATSCGSAPSPELYDLLVDRREWRITRFSRFVTDTVTNHAPSVELTPLDVHFQLGVLPHQCLN